MGVRAVPPWTRDADRALRDASKRVTIISRATPANLRHELERLIDAWESGRQIAPELRYAHGPMLDDLVAPLSRLADELAREGDLGAVYAERASELALEARIVDRVGTPECSALTVRRFGPRDDCSAEADALAHAWAQRSEPEVGGPLVRSDDASDPRSLLSRIRRGIGERKLAVRVVVVENLSPLAAVGDGVIQIAEGRMLSSGDAERTALHEIEGHLVPQARAAREALGIFAFGTAGGSDDQEGRALAIERRAGLLLSGRQAELGRRHLAAKAVHEGAHFVETARLLLDQGAETASALRTALRAHRGSFEGRGGLGREIVYLPALLRVERLLAADPGADDVLGRGRVATAHVGVLSQLVDRRNV